MHKIMKDMVMYLTPYQLKKLKTTLQDKLENVEINLILDKEKRCYFIKRSRCN